VWGEERCSTYRFFWGANQRERDYLEDTSVDGWIILKWTFRKCDGDMDWIDLAHNTDGWWAVVNAAMKFGFQK